MARQVYEENKSRDMNMMVSSSSGGGFCYSSSSSDHHVQQLQPYQIQGFVSDPEMFNLTAGMEMIGFHKNHQLHQQQQQQQHHHDNNNNNNVVQWKSIISKPAGQGQGQGQGQQYLPHQPPPSSSSSKTMNHSSNFYQQQEEYNNINHGHHFVLKNSKYLLPAQELLNEFCSSLDTKHGDFSKQKSQKNMLWEEDQDSGGSSSKKHSLTSIEFAELQKRKTKLLSMLEEVDRRYRHYRNQMKAVVSSFEAVAGNGAATVYSALALKAMSRHFRCLKDGILGQLHITRKTLGEKDPVAPGTTRGETPRLKIIDQTLRQQRAFQQMSMMETHPWRPQRGLPERSVSVLRAWLFEHFLHPYPSDVDKHILARQTGLSRSQVSNWFINARVRLWKPMVEEMYLEETKENENNIIVSSDQWSTDPADHVVQNHNLDDQDDQKPTPDRLVRFDSECASSIIINNNHNHDINKNDPNSFGSVELDFSSYTQHHSSTSGVSLTLGLQQHGGTGTGVSLAFPPPNHQSSLFFSTSSRDQIEDCDQSVVHYSLLDGEGQNQLPYRNLMGAQLLHDFAG